MPPRNSKYTPEIHELIVARIREGNPKSTAFRLVGLHADTCWDWLRYAREDPERYPHFVRLTEDIEQAIAEVQAESVAIIRQAPALDPRNWTAAAWYLERTDPQTWGRKDRVEVDASKSAPLFQLNQIVLTNEDAREQGRALIRRVAGVIEPRQPHEPIELPSPPPVPLPKDD